MKKEDHEATITLSPANEVYDTNWHGRILENGNDFLAKLTCSIEVDEGRRVAFGILSVLPKTRVKKQVDEDVSNRLGFLTWKIIPAYLSNSTAIDLFRTHRIPLTTYLGKRLPKTPKESSIFLVPFKCTITQEVFQCIDDQFAVHSAARHSFDYAVKKLCEFADYFPDALKYHQSELYSMLSFIEQSLECADVGLLYGWYREKQSRIRHGFNDMLRRKQGSHPGYKQAQDDIRSSLYGYRAPDVWHKHPPTLQAETYTA